MAPRGGLKNKRLKRKALSVFGARRSIRFPGRGEVCGFRAARGAGFSKTPRGGLGKIKYTLSGNSRFSGRGEVYGFRGVGGAPAFPKRRGTGCLIKKIFSCLGKSPHAGCAASKANVPSRHGSLLLSGESPYATCRRQSRRAAKTRRPAVGSAPKHVKVMCSSPIKRCGFPRGQKYQVNCVSSGRETINLPFSRTSSEEAQT